MKHSSGIQKREVENYPTHNTSEVGDKAGRGRAKGDWVAVLVARDRQNNTFDKCLDSSTGEAFYGRFNFEVHNR